MKLQTLAVLAATLLFGSCSQIEDELAFLNPFVGEDNLPEVIASDPAPGQPLVSADAIISVVFNKTIDAQKCIAAFSIQPAIRGFFEVSGNTLRFTPADPMENDTYVFSLTKECEDTEGRDLKKEYNASFAVGGAPGNLVRPSLQAINLSAGAIAACAGGAGVNVNIIGVQVTNACVGNPAVNPISFVFSLPMNQNATRSAVSISPGVPGAFTWDPTSTVLTFTPDVSLAVGVRYTVSVSTTAESAGGQTLRDVVTESFVAGLLDSTPPQVTNVAFEQTAPPSGDACVPPADDVLAVAASSTLSVCVNVPLIVTFSEPMDQAGTVGAISFTPFQDATYQWIAANQLAITPLNGFRSVTTYAFSIATSARDLAGNGLQLPFGLLFTTEDARPRVQGIGLASQACPIAGPFAGSPVGGNWLLGSCWWDDSLGVLSPTSYQFRGGDTGTGLVGSPNDCADVNTDNIRILFSNYMELNSTLNAVRLSRLSPPITLLRLASWSWADCQAIAPFGCRRLTLVYAEDASSCNGPVEFGPLTTGDFNLQRTDNAVAGTPIYLLEIDSTARDATGLSLEGGFLFSMEGK